MDTSAALYQTLSGRRATVALKGRVASFSAVLRRLLPFFLLALLAGCGGGGDGGNGSGGDGGDDSQPILGAGGDEEQAEDAPALGFPVFATKNTTRMAGGDAVATAAGAARAVYPSRTDESSPRAVVIVEQDDWRAAISAAQLMARPAAGSRAVLGRRRAAGRQRGGARGARAVGRRGGRRRAGDPDRRRGEAREPEGRRRSRARARPRWPRRSTPSRWTSPATRPTRC